MPNARRAWDTQLERHVVVWSVPRDCDDSRVPRLLGIAPHRNLQVARHDYADGNARQVVLDDLDGEFLADRLASSDSISLDEASRWIGDVRAALAHLHSAGVHHNAVDPDHVALVRDGEIERAVLVGLGRSSRLGRDNRQMQRLARALVDRATLGLTTRASALRLLGVDRPRVRPALAVVAALAVAATAAVTESGEGAPVAAPRTTTTTPGAPLLAAAPASVAIPEGSPLAIESTAPSTEPLALGPLAKRSDRAPLPKRIGVYTPSTDFGKLDVFHVPTDGKPTLQRRNNGLSLAWSHVVPLGDGWLFWYRSFDGYHLTAPVEPDGRLGYGDGTIKEDPGWTHVVSPGNGFVWLYGANTRRARLVRYVDGFHTMNRVVSSPGVAHAVTSVVALDQSRILHYDAKSGRGTVVTIKDDGSIASSESKSLPKNLGALARTANGFLVGVRSGGVGSVMRWVNNGLHHTRDFALDGALWTAATTMGDGVLVTGVAGTARLVAIDDRGVARSRNWNFSLASLAFVIE